MIVKNTSSCDEESMLNQFETNHDEPGEVADSDESQVFDGNGQVSVGQCSGDQSNLDDNQYQQSQPQLRNVPVDANDSVEMESACFCTDNDDDDERKMCRQHDEEYGDRFDVTSHAKAALKPIDTRLSRLPPSGEQILDQRRKRFARFRTFSEGVRAVKQTLITQTSLPCVTSSNNCIKSECCVESRCGGSQEKSPQKPIIPTRIESNTVNSSSLPCITPVIGGRPKSVSPLAVAKPVRPSILKPSKSISGGHRRTCPKGIHQQRPRHRSGDEHQVSLVEPNTVTSSLSNLSSTSSAEQNQCEKLASIDQLLCDLGQHDCNCHHTKSVQILTPIKSEQVLFDPKKSAASLLKPATPDDKSETVMNEKSTNSEMSSNHDAQNPPGDSRFEKHNQYCDCSPEQIQVISVQVCLNCHKPIDTGRQSPPTETMPKHSSPNLDQTKYQTFPSGQALSCSCLGEQSKVAAISLPEMDLDDSCDNFSQTFLFNDFDDQPKFCKKCNVWFGSLDPSYPFRCNCQLGNGDTLNTNPDSMSVYSINMRKDFRYVQPRNPLVNPLLYSYYLQHPYFRFLIAYGVIFLNFLIFAEDPLSHSHMECSIPVLGNVISFLFTKYPSSIEWAILKATLGVTAFVFGLVLGKYLIHHVLLRQLLRLKMFRDESGTWMIMLITSFISCFMFSHVYNILLETFHSNPMPFRINSHMGIKYLVFMKIAACGTWLGDFFTAWMVSDMMFQDNLYPSCFKIVRAIWHKHFNLRILVFWTGAIIIATLVINIILTDVICWESLSQGVFTTTEFTRALIASLILVCDLLIVMQDWDFPHFVCDLNIKLPGLLQPSYTFFFCRKSLKFPLVQIKISGKWFNYGIIVFVMMLDLNMWKNQVIYYPPDYGQYVDPITRKVYTVNDTKLLQSHNTTLWQYEFRRNTINPATNRSFIETDMLVSSRYIGYPAWIKALTLLPIAGGFILFFTLVYQYGRFPPKTDISIGGRLKKRKFQHKSSWRRERRDSRGGYVSWPGITVYNRRDSDLFQMPSTAVEMSDLSGEGATSATVPSYTPLILDQSFPNTSESPSQPLAGTFNMLTQIFPVNNLIMYIYSMCNRSNPSPVANQVIPIGQIHLSMPNDHWPPNSGPFSATSLPPFQRRGQTVSLPFHSIQYVQLPLATPGSAVAAVNNNSVM